MRYSIRLNERQARDLNALVARRDEADLAAQSAQREVNVYLSALCSTDPVLAGHTGPIGYEGGELSITLPDSER